MAVPCVIPVDGESERPTWTSGLLRGLPVGGLLGMRGWDAAPEGPAGRIRGRQGAAAGGVGAVGSMSSKRTLLPRHLQTRRQVPHLLARTGQAARAQRRGGGRISDHSAVSSCPSLSNCTLTRSSGMPAGLTPSTPLGLLKS